MAWIELLVPTDFGGGERPRGFRTDYPYGPGKALVASGAAFWVDGPHKKAEAVNKPKASVKHKKKAAKKEPEPTRSTSGRLSVEDFQALPASDQRDIMRDIGLDGDADLRSSEQMAIVYGAYLSELEG